MVTSDQVRVDEERLAVAALAAAGPPEIRLFLMLAAENRDRKTAPGWTRTFMVCVDTRLAPVVAALILRLSAVGLISETAKGNSSETAWRITDFG